MRAAFALRIFSGKIIFISRLSRSAERDKRIFTGGNSLSQSLTALPAPSGREPLAKPEALQLSRELSRYAKGPISEGAVAVGDWGSSRPEIPLPSCRFASSHLPQGDGVSGGGKVALLGKGSPLGELARSA